MLAAIADADFEQGMQIGLAAVATGSLVLGFILLLVSRRTQAKASDAAAKAAEATAQVAAVANQVGGMDADGKGVVDELKKVDWDKFGELLEKLPESDRAPIIFVVVGIAGWLLVAFTLGWISVGR